MFDTNLIPTMDGFTPTYRNLGLDHFDKLSGYNASLGSDYQAVIVDPEKCDDRENSWAIYPKQFIDNNVNDTVSSKNELLTNPTTNFHQGITMNAFQKPKQSLLAQHDAICDVFVPPLGRIAGLSSSIRGMSVTTQSFRIDKDHDRKQFKEDVYRGFQEFFIKKNDYLVDFNNNLTTPNCSIEGYFETGSNGDEHFQISVTRSTGEANDTELVAFVRFSDNGNSSPSGVKFAAFDPAVLEFTSALKEKYKPVKMFSISLLDVIGTDLSVSEKTVDPRTAVLYDSFYPFIENGAGNLIEEFYNSNSNVLILTGVQGSGKSSLFRTMLNYNTEGKFFVIDNPSIYKQPEAMSIILAHLRKEASDCQVTVALEEIDAFVKEKDIDNMLLPRLLSASAGIVSSNIKFVLMANIPTVGQYAESLTRDGRTFAAINFRELTPEEAEAARSEFGLDPLPFDENQALSTVLNTRIRKPKKIRTSIGFNNQN